MEKNYTVDEIADSINRLASSDKLIVMRHLIPDSAELRNFIARERWMLLDICRERGIEFDSLAEEEKRKIIDGLVNED
jgi:hypothetical protein